MSSWSNLILKYFNVIWDLSSLEVTVFLSNVTHFSSLQQGGLLISWYFYPLEFHPEVRGRCNPWLQFWRKPLFGCSDTWPDMGGLSKRLLDDTIAPQQLVKERSVGKVRSWCSTSTTGIHHGTVAGVPLGANSRCLVLHLNSEGEGEKKKQERKWSVETHVPVTGYSCLSKWHEWYFVWLLIWVIGKKDKRTN